MASAVSAVSETRVSVKGGIALADFAADEIKTLTNNDGERLEKLEKNLDDRRVFRFFATGDKSALRHTPWLDDVLKSFRDASLPAVASGGDVTPKVIRDLLDELPLIRTRLLVKSATNRGVHQTGCQPTA